MFLFPYRAQIKLHKVPTATIAVAVVCLGIYFFQARNEAQLIAHAVRVCGALAETSEGGAEALEHRWNGQVVTCERMVLYIHGHRNPEEHLAWHIEELHSQGDSAGAERVREQYRAFAAQAPRFLTARLWHDRSRFDPIGMLTSSFAHGSWDHVIFNLIFFFAFAASVELILGPVLFLGSIAALSFGIGLFDLVITRWEGDPIPSLGLSGVVMGMLALFAYFLPRAKIRMFFWFLFSLGTVGIPAWIVAAWYIGWDLYDQLAGSGGYINFVAHLSGAAFGFALGVGLFRSKRHWTKELVLESGAPDLRQEEGALRKLNGILVAPAVGGFAVLASLFLIWLAISFVERYWLLMLMVAPAALAGYQILRSRRADRPLREQYQLGVDALARHEYEKALKHLEPLARKNDTRALFALANLYARGGASVMRNEARALDLYTRAAARGHGEAQYILGAIYAEGRGVPRDVAKAVAYYENAERAGIPDAANSLGYLYENGIGLPADRERAIEWYYRAAVGYRKAGRLDDAQAVVRHLESLAPKYPAVLGLVTKLKLAMAGGRG